MSDNDTVDLSLTELPAAPIEQPDGPRTRWAAIIWGVALAAAGVLALRMLLTAAARDAVYEWATTTTPLTVVACVLLVLGSLLVIAGLVGLARRLQRAAAGRRANGDVGPLS